jgi:hypothetical protein
MDTITTTQLITAVYAFVGIMLAVALYHVIIILVDIRKIVRKAVHVSEHLESTVIQPLSWVEQGIGIVTAMLGAKTHISSHDEDDEEDSEKKSKSHKHHDKKD